MSEEVKKMLEEDEKRDEEAGKAFDIDALFIKPDEVREHKLSNGMLLKYRLVPNKTWLRIVREGKNDQERIMLLLVYEAIRYDNTGITIEKIENMQPQIFNEITNLITREMGFLSIKT